MPPGTATAAADITAGTTEDMEDIVAGGMVAAVRA
jgi:hypothetical protein